MSSTYTPQYQRPYTDGYVDRPDESTPEYARFINARDAALIRIEAFLAALQIPEKLSELVNDEGFIKNTVSNLANYYLKSETYARTETYTQAEVQALIADAVSKVSGKLNISVVDALPTSDISTTTFYLVPKETAQEKNLYDEYINTDGTESGWEFIGGVSTSIDLSDYYKKSEVDALLDGKMNKADIVPSKFEGTKAVIGNQVSSGGGGSDMHVYSTEEKVVGTWVDGRPVYEKTIQISDNRNTGAPFEIIFLENIDFLVQHSVMFKDIPQNGAKYILANYTGTAPDWFHGNQMYIDSNNDLLFRFDGAGGELKIFGVIQYVRTTDTATT